MPKKKDPKRWQDVIIESPHARLTKQEVFDYYSIPKIQKAILDAAGNRETLVRQSFKPEFMVLRRKSPKGEFIHLTPNQLEKWKDIRATEFHPTFGKRTKELLVDIDPQEGVSWDRAQRLTETVAKTMRSEDDVKRVGVQYSGGRGFYVRGELDKKMDTDKARQRMRDILNNVAQRPDVTFGIAEPGQTRLDLTPFKYRGSVRAPYSLNAATGLVAAPVKEKDLGTLKKQDFTIGNILGKKACDLEEHRRTAKEFHEKLKAAIGQTKSAAKGEFAPGILKNKKIHNLPTIKKEESEWMMAVQEHKAKRAGKHFDLRLVQPLTDRAHSWAIPKAKLPGLKDKMLLAVQQPTHKSDYALNFTGTIPEGYGAGTVTMPMKEKATVLYADKDRLGFKLKGGDQYALFRTKGNKWGIKKVVEKRDKDRATAFIRKKMR